MKTLLRLLLKSQHQQNRSGRVQTEKGMTLIELLIGTVMAFLIVTPMLAFVVDMLNTDRREQIKSNTEQDIQAAVDFIAQDLSQAIYIYDGKGINDIKTQLPANNDANKTPIMVFWKRQQIERSLPIDPAAVTKPNTCDATKCNDTYVLSLVAYYQIKETDPQSIWCQPSSGINDCPTRIARYEIRDGVKDPLTLNYYTDGETTPGQRKNPAFNTKFNLSNPTKEVTIAAGFPAAAANSQVLLNYIDHSPGTILTPCTTALGSPTDPKDKTKFLDEDTLKVTDPTKTINSFYACVDTEKNLARVTIRGNSLRRIQPNDANYNASKSAFFPTASVQVQGLGARGK